MKGFSGGTVQVANDVIDVIIATTALRVDDVLGVKGFHQDKNRLNRNYKSNINTNVEGGKLRTALTIYVKMGRPLVEIVEEVQAKVAEQVESMLGIPCDEVHITVAAR